MRERDVVSLLSISDEKVLLVVSKDKKTWSLPGGKKEPGETDEETLVRECKEELSVDILTETIRYTGKVNGPAYEKPQGSVVEVTVYQASFVGPIKPNAEIADAQYFFYRNLPQISQKARAFLDNLHAKGLFN